LRCASTHLTAACATNRRRQAADPSSVRGNENHGHQLVRFKSNGGPRWGVALPNGVAPLAGEYATTTALIERGEDDWRAAAGHAPSIGLEAIELLSPVTTPCRVFCQGANYRRHMIESGLDPDAKAFNMFFTKADASISPPIGTVRPPDHVNLLDYEIELALVFRRSIRSPITVTPKTLKDYVYAATIANDISARDVQLPQTQFFKGKSYRGFCPIGPRLTVLEPSEFALLDRLDLRLSVNDVLRQATRRPTLSLSRRRRSRNCRP
jgi:2-keto-4-pentenoate hydratase/2-oxohepta-3-ene-1,7-dioic acid hydratase in catechol pathway